MQGFSGAQTIGLRVLAMVLSLGAGLQAAADAPADVEAIAAKNRDAVVTLFGEREGEPNAVQSSGCCVDPSGLFLTVAHAVDGVDRIRARFGDGSERILSVVTTDASRDIAVLRSTQPVVKFATIGSVDRLKPGSPLVAISTPKGLQETVASGIVSNMERVYLGRPVLQTDLSVIEGSSGGPVFDRGGRMVGLVRARLDAVEKATLIAPVDEAFELLRQCGVNPADSATSLDPLMPDSGASDAERQAIEAYNRGVWAVSLEAKIGEYRRAVLLRPDFFEAWFNLGVSFASAEQHEDAILAYRNAERARPSSIEVQRNLGRELLRTKLYDEVEKCFKRARELAPNDPGVNNDLGELYRRTGRLGNAAACFQNALRVRPDYAAARYNLGLTFASMERWGEAAACFRGYIHDAPNASDVEKVREMIADLEQRKRGKGKVNGGGF